MSLSATSALPYSIQTRPPCRSKSLRATLLWIFLAAGALHFSYLASSNAVWVLVYLFALVQLSRAETWRKAFYGGLAVGLIVAIGKLDFFWRIFGTSSVALWLVYAFWIGLFTVLARICFRQLPAGAALLVVPTVWCGLEYFRSELYYLRFGWVTPGLAFGLDPAAGCIAGLGVYGLGFVLMVAACAATIAWQLSRRWGGVVLAAAIGLAASVGWLNQPRTLPGAGTLSIAGVQLEFPNEKEVLTWLNELIRRHPEAQLLVLSEYTFEGSVPDSVRNWCRQNQRYLLAGAKEPASGARFYNVAEVVAPSGEIVFRQVKSVPIQFFNDGLPAPQQRVWESPWGKLGICICHDLSYTRITDRLIRLGAQALIVPTMDVADWGERQHRLHSRIGPVRAAEYGVPVFRLASSGISQAIDSSGRIISSAPFPGQGAILAAKLSLSQRGRRPIDRWLAPAAAAFTILGTATLSIGALLGKRTNLWRNS